MAIQVTYPHDDEEAPSPEELKVLQTYCGNFNWLATHTRADISYYISVIASVATKHGQWSLALCKKVARYLASTYDQGVVFTWSSPVVISAAARAA